MHFTEELGLLKEELYVVTVERISKECSNKVQHNNWIQVDGRCGCHARHALRTQRTEEYGLLQSGSNSRSSHYVLDNLIVEVGYSLLKLLLITC